MTTLQKAVPVHCFLVVLGEAMFCRPQGDKTASRGREFLVSATNLKTRDDI